MKVRPWVAISMVTAATRNTTPINTRSPYTDAVMEEIVGRPRTGPVRRA